MCITQRTTIKSGRPFEFIHRVHDNEEKWKSPGAGRTSSMGMRKWNLTGQDRGLKNDLKVSDRTNEQSTKMGSWQGKKKENP